MRDERAPTRLTTADLIKPYDDDEKLAAISDALTIAERGSSEHKDLLQQRKNRKTAVRRKATAEHNEMWFKEVLASREGIKRDMDAVEFSEQFGNYFSNDDTENPRTKIRESIAIVFFKLPDWKRFSISQILTKFPF